MNQKHTILSLVMMFSASCLFAQSPYDHDIYHEIVVRSLKAMENHGTPGANAIPAPVKPKAFSNAAMVPVTNASFSEGCW